jgi:hypothetical protein
MNIAVDLFPADPRQAKRLGDAFEAEYKLVVELLTAAYDLLPPDERARVLALDDAFSRYRDKLRFGTKDPWTDPLPFLEWARSVVPGAFSRVLTGRSEGETRTREETRRAAARTVTRRVPWVDGRRLDGVELHGTRGYEEVRLDGICVKEASQNIDTDANYPEEWQDMMESSPPMSVVDRWGGIDMDYGWIGLWRGYLWNWWRGLTPRARKVVAEVCGWREVPTAAKYPRYKSDVAADFLGDSLALFWTTESERTADAYARGGAVLEIDTSQINAFGAFDDDIVSGGGTVWVLPLWCPQVPITAIRDHGTGRPLGSWAGGLR